MTTDPEMTEVVRREVGEALDELLSLTERYTDQSIPVETFVRDTFRVFHNTKGALRLGGFAEPERVAHAVEDELAALRAGSAAPVPHLIDLMEQAMSACLYAVEGDGTHPELALVLRKLTAHRGQPESPGDAATVSSQAAVAEPGGEHAPSHETIRIETERLSLLMDLGSEYLAQHSRLRRQGGRLRDFSDRFSGLLKRDPSLREALREMFSDFEIFVRQEERELRRFTQLTADFDGAMRAIRMQPLSGIVPQLRRIVNEAARELDKKAHLVTNLGEVELDREVLDALREPLSHLLRNAVDHGLEGDAERASKNKDLRGEVRVEARVAGANVQVTISDDGRGIDVDKLRRRAEELQILTDGLALDDESLIDKTLFFPGFSTATKVTNYSGRGVGLDVVRSRVSELGGTVSVERRPSGQGVTFVLSVPASVVSLRGLSVAAGGYTYVIPSSHVERTLRIRADQIGSAEGVTVTKGPDGAPLRLRWLSTEMQRPRTEDPPLLQVVLIREGSQRLGLVVDEVQGDTTYVIKRLPWNLKRVHGVIGATHQGDATLALVVDVIHIFRQGAAAAEHRLKVAPRTTKLRILVADDSLTSRTLERNILLEAGFDVEVRDDGQKALDTLEQAEFDLLVSDVQMPNMDGLELTRAVRAHPKLSRLPIILVTSLDRPEDIKQGAEAGADEYIIKGQFDQGALLRAVNRLI